MKKVLLIAAAVMLIASSVSASAYIGIYKDLLHSINYTNCGVLGITGYIWTLPDALGIVGVEFAVDFPEPVPGGYQSLAVTANALLSPAAIGTLAEGMSCSFTACQTTWAYTHKFTLYNYDEYDEMVPWSTPDLVSIIPHPDTGKISLASCEENYPMYTFVYLTPLYICRTSNGPLGVTEKNWGAIKSLF